MKSSIHREIILTSVLASLSVSLLLNVMTVGYPTAAATVMGVSDAPSATVSAVPSSTCSVLPSTNAVYVANFKSKTLQKIDPSSLTVIAKADTISTPYSAVVSPDGQYVYVPIYNATVNPGVGYIQKFNAKDLSVAVTLSAGDNMFPIKVVVSPDGNYLYATFRGGSGSTGAFIEKIATADMSIVATTTNVETLPVDTVISPDGKYIYTSTGIGPYVLEKYNTSDLSLALKANTGNFCGTGPIAISPNGGYVYITIRGGCDKSTWGIQKFRTSDLGLAAKVVTTSSLPYTGPLSVAVSPDGSYVYAPVQGSDSNANYVFYLEKHNASDLALVQKVSLGDAVHWGKAGSITVSYDAQYVYVPYGIIDTPHLLQKFNASDLSVAATVTIDDGPGFVAVPSKVIQGVVRKVGDRETNFLLQQISASSVSGVLWYTLGAQYPTPPPKTLQVGGSVGYACQGITAVLACIDASNQTATFNETLTISSVCPG